MTVTLVALTASPALGHATFPGRNGLIAWGFDHGGPACPPFGVSCRLAYEIKAVGPRGHHRKVLACDAASPRFSPDGQRLLFARTMGGLFVLRLGSQRKPKLVPGTERVFEATWAPNGKRFAFNFVPPGSSEHRDIYTLRPDGAGLRRLTSDQRSAGPLWGPDGRIAFTSGYLGGHPGVFVINRDGSGRRRLTRAGRWANDPQALVVDGPESWSPDAKWIAFSRGPTDNGTDIYVVRSDGRGHARRVAAGAEYAAWSPDGRWIAVAPEFGREIDLVRPDGSDRHRLALEPHYGAKRCGNQQYSGLGQGAGFAGIDWQPLP